MHDGTILSQHLRTLTLLVQDSRFRMFESYRAIAVSRLRIFRRPWICGGAGEEAILASVREQIRERLVDGSLPRTDGRAWAGRGRGINRCACCGAVIATGAVECEPRDLAGLHAHAPCFTAWLAESDLLRV